MDESDNPVTINRRFELDAGHRLSRHDFKCQNFHGHRYKYEVEIRGIPDAESGYVIDFSNIKAPIMDAFDHNFLFNQNDPLLKSGVIDMIQAEQAKEPYLMDCEPTVENIARESIRLIWESMATQEQLNVTSITMAVWETPNCDVEMRAISPPGEASYRVI